MYRILYVDDEECLLEIGRTFLEKTGKYSVTTIESANAAVDLLAHEKFDAIISDYLMPGMNGIEFLQHLRASGATVPFIILTGRGREEVVIQALNGGADFYLQKGEDFPAQFVELDHKIRIAIGRRETEEKVRKAGESLRRSEEQHRLILQTAMDGFLLLDRQGHLLEVNETYCRMTGYSREELLSMSVFDLEVFESAEEITRRMERIFAKGEDRFESRHRRKDGSPLYIQSSIQYKPDDGGWFIVFIHDITDRKCAEKNLLESEQKHRALVEATPDIIWEIDLAGSFTYISPRVLDILGYPPETLIGTTGFSYISPESEPCLRELFSSHVESGTGIAAMNIPVRHRDGHIVILEIRASPVMGRTGKISGFRGLAHDITERKQYEDRIRESEVKYRSIVENTNDAVYIHTLDGTILDVNDNACRMSGYSREELVGAGLAKIDKGWRSPENPDLDTLIRTDKNVFERENIRKDGRVIPVEVSGIILRQGGKVVCQAFVRDISERKRAEEALRGANRQLNLLTGITRHDILNNISCILGFIALAEMESKDPADREYFEKIRVSAHAARSQIEFTRLYQNIGIHEPQWQDLSSLVTSMTFPGSITLQNDLNGVCVYADPMIARVFENLLDNSIRHGEHVSRIRVSASETEEGLIFTWEDDGIGIPEDEKEHIFERGYGKNTGLGLFLVREILGLTRIRIRERGVPGKGARFEIVVPDGTYRMKS